jgi:hypothetical protein
MSALTFHFSKELTRRRDGTVSSGQKLAKIKRNKSE